jgi:hypothetical protein
MNKGGKRKKKRKKLTKRKSNGCYWLRERENKRKRYSLALV